MKEKTEYERNMIFFFKQKTAYEMLRSIVGSEMCISNRSKGACTRSEAVRFLLAKCWTWEFWKSSILVHTDAGDAPIPTYVSERTGLDEKVLAVFLSRA